MKHPLQHTGMSSALITKSFFRRRWRQPAGAWEGPPDPGHLNRPAKGTPGGERSGSGRFRKLALTCLLLASAGFLPLYGQTKTQWDRTFGGDQADNLQTLQQTSDGGYILGGYSFSSATGDKTQAAKGVNDYWVIKLQADGTKAWDKTLGGSGSDNLTSLQQTSDGGYILGGISNSSISGDKTQAAQGANDFWVVRLDAAGNKIWDKTFGGVAGDNLYALRQTSDGGFILGGNSSSGISGDKSSAARGGIDYWVVKLDAAGNKVWDKTFGGTGNETFTSLQQTSDGGYLLGGYSNSGVGGDKSQPSRGMEDYWVVKLQADGTKVWDKTFGGNDYDRMQSLQQTSDGGYILGGYSTSEAGGDKTQTDIGLWDYWVVKLRADGTTAWDKTIGGYGTEALYALQQTSDGGYLLGGYSNSGVGGDKSQAGKGYNDYWVVKLQADGTKAWDKTFGGSGTDNLTSLQQTTDGWYILGGYSDSNISGDKSQPAQGVRDFWVVKLGKEENSAPAVSSQDLSTAKGTPLAIHLVGTDAENDALTFQIVQAPAHGSLSGTAPDLTYTPAADYQGPDAFVYTASDGNLTSLPASVSITVTLQQQNPAPAAGQLAVQWDRTLGGSSEENLQALQQTSDGGYILGGYSTSGISGDKTQAWQGWRDFWVVKLQADGTKAWDKTIGGQLDDQLTALQQTRDGGYILGGYSNSGDDDEGDYLVMKLDAAGNQVWSKNFGYMALDYLTALQQTSDGGYILGGRSHTNFANIYDWGKADTDYWVIKLDAAGNKVWDKNFGGTGYDDLTTLQQTRDGGYILGGHSKSGISGNKTQASKGGDDYWVVKLDAAGNKVWDKTIGGIDNDVLRSLKQTADDGYILGGYSTSGISGDKTQASKGGDDYWVVKLDAAGNKVWDKTFGGSGSENLASLQITADGGYLLGGYSYSPISGDKTQASQGSADYWLVQLDAAGNKSWDKTVGGNANDLLQALQLTSDGGYVLGGSSASGISGDKTQAHLGGGDYWVVKLAKSNNTAPLALLPVQALTLAEDMDVAIQLSGSDAEKDPLTFTVTQAPLHGTLSGTAPNLTYTPDKDYNGPDAFTFTVSDGQLASAPATVNLAVTAVNDAPKLAPISSLVSNAGELLSLVVTATDVDNPAAGLSLSLTGAPAGATFDAASGQFTWTPAASQAGTHFLVAEVSDGLLTHTQAFTITVNGPAVHRINAGGQQLTNSIGAFAADNHFSPAPGYTYSTTSPIAGTLDDALYQTERASDVDHGSFGYDLPVANGPYTVVLHFAELYWNAPGQRVFDVSLEKALALDDYDIIQKTGAKNTATTEAFLVTVTDGRLNIDFSALAEYGGVNRPKVSAIEVIPYSGTYAFPVAGAGADKIVTYPGTDLILEGRGTETHGRVDMFTWTQVSGPNTARFYPYNSAPSVFGLLPGTYVFSLTIMDDKRAVSAPDQMTVTVLADPNAPVVAPAHLIHAGGGQVTAASGIFAADHYYSNGPGSAYNPTTHSTTSPIAGTPDDALYQTERTSEEDNGAFGYALPVDNGLYTVVLHFAEIYWQAPGQRVFDVRAEGNLALDNYDIVQKAGANFTATTESFVVEVSDGTLDLLFSALAGEGGVNRPKVSAIEVIPYTAPAQARLALTAGSQEKPEADLTVSLSAYPNPFRQQINLNMAGVAAGQYTIRVLDVLGRQLYRSGFTAGAGSGPVHTISLADKSLTSGSLYLVVVEQAGGPLRKVIKVMKE